MAERSGGSGRGGNAMVKSELEAAEALAGLARSENWNKEERGEMESEPQHDSVVSWTAALRLSSDSTAEDEPVNGHHQSEIIQTIAMKKANINAELYRSSTISTRIHTYTSGSKSRQKMTEDEKEARRIRRVLANRESARQTIRRRKAMYEELISKAACLTQENENLKQELDSAVQEYDSLKTTNESLKKQMVKAASTEQEENQTDQNPATELSKSSCSYCPLFVYNQSPPFPFLWPAFVQPPNSVQTQNQINLFSEQGIPENKDVPNPPLYIMPCPFFYPVSDHGAMNQSFDTRNEQIVTPMSYSYTSSSSTKTTGYRFGEAKAEASSSKATFEVPFKFQEDPSSPSVLVKPIPSFKPKIVPQTEFISSDGPLASTCSNTFGMVKEQKLDLNICPSTKQVDAVAAAVARKRRKELTKLRSLHYRDLAMS